MKGWKIAVAAAVAVAAGGALWAARSGDAPAPPADATEVMVYKSPACGCCSAWAEHMRAAGFEVREVDREDMRSVKAELGVQPGVESCHTAVVGGYVVEGHVPAREVIRLLREEPPVAGLAVPGMPVGSPGMEGPREESYQVLTFDGEGNTTVWSRH
jgi:hypothetical protein